VCFSENFCWQTKNIQNFFGDNTRFTPGIEAWSRATKKRGFRMDTKKNLILKGKGYDLILTPGPNVSWYKSTKKHYRGRKPIKLHILILVSFKGSKLESCRVPDSWVVCTFDFQVEDAVYGSPYTPLLRKITKNRIESFAWESFPKLLVLLDKMHADE